MVREVNDSMDNTHIKINDWKHSLDNCLEAMGPAWPSFEAFKSSSSFQTTRPTPISSGRRESQVAFDLINSTNRAIETSSTSVDESPSVYTTSPSFGNVSQSSNVSQPSMSHRASSFGQSSIQSALNAFDQSPQTIFPASSNTSWPLYPQSQGLQMQAQAQPTLQPPRSVRSDFEPDPMFQEFATLDATEWYTTHSLTLH